MKFQVHTIFGKTFLLTDKGRREEEEEEVSIKINIKKKRTKIRGVSGCWPEHIIKG